MNREILTDKLFSVWIKMPHCRLIRYLYVKKIRNSIEYEQIKGISIISTNCIGGELYSLLGLQFCSPFINVSIDRKQFVVLCEHLAEFMITPIKVQKCTNGSCEAFLSTKDWGEVRIKFPHDTNPQIVEESWNRRKSRINWDRIVLICDDAGLNQEDILRFDGLSAYKKIMFTGGGIYPRAMDIH